jgi:hypothetical protein
MVHMRLTARRALTAAAVVTLGAAGALAVVLPAHAAALTVTGSATCDHGTGRWQVTWSVTADAGSVGTVTAVSTGPDGASTPAGLAVDDAIDAGPVGVSSTAPGDADVATLTVGVDWTEPEPGSESVTGTVDPTGDCVEDTPVPSASFDPQCDGSVTVTLANDAVVLPVEFEITAGAGFTVSRTVAADASTTVDVPSDAAGQIVVQADNRTIRTGGWEEPGGCATSAPPTTAPPTSGGDDGDDEDGGDSGGEGEPSTSGNDGGHPSTGTRSGRGGGTAASPTPTRTPDVEEPAVEEDLPETEEPAALASQPPPPLSLSGGAGREDEGIGGTAVLVAWAVAGLAVLSLVIAILNGVRRKRGRRRYERYVSPFASFH